jgi:type I restriction enzyme S subunit
MGLKVFTIDSNILATSKHCRLDQKYTSFTYIDNWSVFYSKYPQVKLSDFLEEIPIRKFKKGELDDEYYLVNISDQQQRSGELENIEITNEIGSDKNCLGDADVFVSKLGMPRGYIFINTYKNQKLLGSTEFIPYKIKDKKLKIFLKYILLHPRSLKAYSYLESGKTPSHRRVNPYEFLKIKIPLIPKTTQDKLVAQIEPIEQKIKELRKQIKEPQEVINKVFAREFGFDLDKFEELKKEKFFEVNLSTLSISKDIRSATKFHNSIFDFLLLSQFKKYRFKDFINIKKTTLGRQIQPQYFEEESKFYYVGPNSLKSFLFDSNLIAPIKKEFFVKNQHLQVEMNDILLVASGEGSIGKSAIYNDKITCITSQFVMKINFIDKSVVQYFHFYMQSSFFQLIVEKYKKGMGNMTNIFVSQLVDFPVLFSEKHKQIVDEIKAELDKQEEIKQQIEQERNKIDEIIEIAIV